MQVHTELGYGFLERVYEHALMVALTENRITACQQVPAKVEFHGETVGKYIVDILVENSVILELTAQDNISRIHRAQTLNYLRATSFKLALLINFGKEKLEFERFVN